jgi:hypothetical protein
MLSPLKIPLKSNDKLSRVYNKRLSPKISYTPKTKGLNDIINKRSQSQVVKGQYGQWDTKIFIEDQSPVVIQTQKYWFETAKWFNSSNRIKNKDLTTLFSDFGKTENKKETGSFNKIILKWHTPQIPFLSKIQKPAIK